MWYVIFIPVVAVAITHVVYNWQAGRCHSQRRLDGKTALVTGASAGIGKETALDLAKRGARVILACRNVEKAQHVADEIIKESGNSDVVVREVDTSDLSSVRHFANEILKTETHLDILVNNAGIFAPYHRTLTTDGLELTMATNHYGHFLLTNILLELLKKSAPSRIVNVSSTMHHYCGKLDPEDLSFEKTSYNSFKAYNQSKLCNVLFTLELSERLRGSGIIANSLHPGCVRTEIASKAGGLSGFFLSLLQYLVSKDSKLGAQTSIHLAVSEEIDSVSGKYFVDCKESTCSKLASHRGMSKKLWLASELDVKLEPHESILYTS
ncbi:retinol dehydrogenase 13-like isoform X1 [Macrobrachium rosenbergii]|uniref:retinol dehydrogenase 13-like isoform X1 n=1 Tax=Macrobrachium rosenbergii TaxID=79674 RepID=UPI0034D3EFDF